MLFPIGFIAWIDPKLGTGGTAVVMAIIYYVSAFLYWHIPLSAGIVVAVMWQSIHFLTSKTP